MSDNVFSSELAQLCSLVSRQGGPEETQAQDIADRLVQYSRTCMVNQKRISPFESALYRLYKLTVADESLQMPRLVLV